MSAGEAAKDDDAAAPGQEPFLLYDGECPFCSFYVAKSRFEARTGRPLRLIDGRKAPDLVARLRRDGLDLDRGMILALDGRRHHGAAAMSVLAALTTGSGVFARLVRWFVSSPARARVAYPWLRLLRRAALLVKGTPGFRA